jgi:RNA polymerase sigma-70 factor, ECF subfamily
MVYPGLQGSGQGRENFDVRCWRPSAAAWKTTSLMARSTVRLRGRRLRLLADEELVRQAREGNALAFEVIFDRHAGVAFSLAYRMCGRRALAEDVVQDAFVSLWRSGTRYERARGTVRAWVLGVVRNKALDAFRRETAKAGLDVHDDVAVEGMPAAELTELEVERGEDAEQVRGALAQLPVEQRRVIELAYFGGFTHTEIAGILELPSGTVKSRIRLGLQKLRLSLAKPIAVASVGGMDASDEP